MNLFNSENVNIFASGVVAGFFCTSIVLPVEKVKIRAQTSGRSNLISIIRNEGLLNLYKGWTATCFRDIPGYGIFFLTYEVLCRNTQNITPLHTFAYGSIAGSTSWLFIYPSDPVKTIMQNENKGLLTATNEIYSKYGLRGFYRGFLPAIVRVAPFHGFVFLFSEIIKKMY